MWGFDFIPWAISWTTSPITGYLRRQCTPLMAVYVRCSIAVAMRSSADPVLPVVAISDINSNIIQNERLVLYSVKLENRVWQNSYVGFLYIYILRPVLLFWCSNVMILYPYTYKKRDIREQIPVILMIAIILATIVLSGKYWYVWFNRRQLPFATFCVTEYHAIMHIWYAFHCKKLATWDRLVVLCKV